MSTEKKEEFCGACLGGAVALIGAGTAGYGASSKSKESGRKKILIISGVVTFVFALAIIAYFIWVKDCDSCR